MTNGNRMIAKLVSTILISVGISGVGAGVVLCKNAVDNNAKDYNNDTRYIAGVATTSLCSPLAAIGVATYPYKSKEDNTKSL